MKRIGSLLRAFLLSCCLLSACSAPAASSLSDALPPAEVVSAQLQTPVEKPLEMVRGPQGFASNEYPSAEGIHIIECLDQNGNGPDLMTFYDFNTMKQRILCEKPGCLHRDETCPACMPTTHPKDRVQHYLLGIVDGTLYWVTLKSSFTSYTSATFQKQVLDGSSFPQTIAELEPSDWENAWPGAVFCDGENFYMIQRRSVFARIALDDGKTTTAVPELPGGEFGGWFLGASNDGKSLYGTSLDGGAHQQIFGIDSQGNVEPLFTLPENSGAISFWQGLLYYCNVQDGSIYVFDPVTQKTQLLTTALAPYARANSGGYCEASGWMFKRFGDWLLVDEVYLEKGADCCWRAGVNLTTGEVRTDLELGYFWIGSVRPLTIWAETPRGLLVTPEMPRFVVHTRGSDGRPYDQETSYATYAFLSLEDFLANRPTYRQIASLPHN